MIWICIALWAIGTVPSFVFYHHGIDHPEPFDVLTCVLCALVWPFAVPVAMIARLVSGLRP